MRDYVQASYGGIDFFVTDVSTEEGRDIVVKSPARGDKHTLFDRGKKLLSTTCSILFCDEPGKEDLLLRFDNFRDRANTDTGSATFSHPLIGSYLARIAEFSHQQGEGTGNIRCTAKFLAEDEPQPIIRSGGGVPTLAGVESVTAASGIATAALADLGLLSDLPLDAIDTVQAWANGDELDSQAVFAEMASFGGALNTAIDTLDLLTDLSRWQAYRAFVQLQGEVERAAEALTAAAALVFDVIVRVDRPLIAIATDVYGAAAGPTKADQIAKLNRVRTPGLVPAGTRLKFPQKGARP